MHRHASPPPVPRPPVVMQLNAKLSHPLLSKINANSVTCQVENVLSKLPNECVCVRREPHRTLLPAGSYTHYPCGITPPSDRLQLSAHCFLCRCARVSLSLLSLPGACANIFLLPECNFVLFPDVRLTNSCQSARCACQILSRPLLLTYTASCKSIQPREVSSTVYHIKTKQGDVEVLCGRQKQTKVLNNFKADSKKTYGFQTY